MSQLITEINLPPGAPSSQMVRQILQLCLERFGWFSPARYGASLTPQKLDRKGRWLDTLVAFFEQEEMLSIADSKDQHQLYLLPDRFGHRSYWGSLTWYVNENTAQDSVWRSSHAEQVTTVMKLVDSPLAIAAIDEDIERKRQRWVREGLVEKRVLNLRDYSEGLVGLFWRNFFGPPFVRIFGERLKNLPTGRTQDFRDGIWLVEPYQLPEDAGTAEGQKRESKLIEHLGADCFYNHEHNRKPTRRPDLPILT